MFAEVKKLNKKVATRLAIISSVAVGMAVIALFITATRPKHTQFCAKCHNNVSFNNGCKRSRSGDVACIECHTHKNTGTAVMATEMKDEHCTAETCHPRSKLSAKGAQYKTIKPFQHKTHRDMLTENFKLRCTSCHASLGGDKHFDIDMNTCNICHFIDTQKPLYTQSNKPISDCTLCHSHTEKTRDIYGKTFLHTLYEENEKVGCSDCHFNTFQGHGKVIKESCYQCHLTVADNFRSTSDMHYQHIVKHKTTCTSCHASIEHGWVKTNNKVSSDGNPLLVDTDHKIQNLIMLGLGGAGVEGEPDPMYLATLNCSACHKDKQQYTNVKPDICNNCHERGFDKILTEQMRFVTARMHVLKTLLGKAKKRHYLDTNRIIQEAEINYNLIKEDGSLGAHNIKYVKYLLDYGIANLKQTVK